MPVDVEAANGATITVYWMRGIPFEDESINIITRVDHLLECEDQIGWTAWGSTEPKAYPPCDMAVEFKLTGFP